MSDISKGSHMARQRPPRPLITGEKRAELFSWIAERRAALKSNAQWVAGSAEAWGGAVFRVEPTGTFVQVDPAAELARFDADLVRYRRIEGLLAFRERWDSGTPAGPSVAEVTAAERDLASRVAAGILRGGPQAMGGVPMLARVTGRPEDECARVLAHGDVREASPAEGARKVVSALLGVDPSTVARASAARRRGRM